MVPGDIVRLSAGDLVPADARFLIARDIYVQQAALTGESLPAEKEATGEPASSKADARNMVFLGTSIVSGTATAEVVATGTRTAFGDIAARLAARPEETAFDKGLRNFSHLLARTVFFLVLFLIVVSITRHRDVLQSLLFAVALAVGLTPEFLPMITSVTLSKGAVAMAHKKVIVKPISSVFDFLTFYVLLHFFRTSEAQFHTGWFVESLATQTLVLFVIRTSKNPLRSRPSGPLMATCLAVVAIGVYLPFSPLTGVPGFTALPGAYFAFLALATGAYLCWWKPPNVAFSVGPPPEMRPRLEMPWRSQLRLSRGVIGYEKHECSGHR